MVLADALAYARLELGATVLVDVATLTGAMKVALGTRTAGLFATTDGLADALRTAGVRAGEPLWRMPLARGVPRPARQHRRRRQQRARQPRRHDGRAVPAAVRRRPAVGAPGRRRPGPRRLRRRRDRSRAAPGSAPARCCAGWRPARRSTRRRPSSTEAFGAESRETVRLSVPKAGSLADGAVDRLAQQVGVAGVPGGLLDHVQQHPAQVEVRARCGDVPTESWSRLSAAATTSRLRAQASRYRRRSSSGSSSAAVRNS